MERRTPITRILVITNLLVYAVQLLLYFFGDSAWFTTHWGLSQWGMERGWVWQLLSYAWIHSETLPIHIFFNLMMVWSLGAALEEELGGRRFLTLYGVGVLGAAVLWLSLDFAPEHVVGGASGAVFALLLGLAALDPQQPVKALVFFVIPWRARIGVMAWSTMTVELVLQLTGIWPEIAHAAHLGGGLAGWLLGRHYRKQLHLEYMKRHGYYGGVAAF